MPRKSSFRQWAEMYLVDCQRRRLSPVTLEGYEYTLRRAEKALKENNLLKHPKRIREEEIDVILTEFGNSKWYAKTFNVFLNWTGNDVMRRMALKWPSQILRADWLDPVETEQFYNAFMSMEPPYKTLGHLELCLGFRRISCKRALTTDFKHNRVIVHGKGRMGGKDYTIFPHPETDTIIEETRDHNNDLLNQAKSSAKMSHLFLYRKGSRIQPYTGDTSYDTLLSRICSQAGVWCSHHTLRRTFGRTLWEALGRRDIETVSETMGHKSIEQTRRYLGIKLEDMRRAMTKLGEYQRNRKKMYLLEISQSKERA